MTSQCYENYPSWIVVITNLFSLSIFFIGGFVIYQLGLVWLIIYIGYLLFLEIKLLSGHCPNCYYYGKTCAFGKGRISSCFFKKGDPAKFIEKKITWKDIVPDFLVTIIPVIAGIILLVKDFNWLILILLIILFILGFSGNALIRGQLSCKFCKQKESGCPALELFDKKKN